MIQKTSQSLLNAIRTDTVRSGASDVWGQWVDDRHYSLEVIQQPVRARMCGFGDKDRRPLAPAAVAKMIVRRADNSLLDVDDVDINFFVVTIDLWSADATQDMNLVLHPYYSPDRSVPTYFSRSKSLPSSTSESSLPPLTPSRSTRPTPYPSRNGRPRLQTTHPPGPDLPDPTSQCNTLSLPTLAQPFLDHFGTQSPVTDTSTTTATPTPTTHFSWSDLSMTNTFSSIQSFSNPPDAGGGDSLHFDAGVGSQGSQGDEVTPAPPLFYAWSADPYAVSTSLPAESCSPPAQPPTKPSLDPPSTLAPDHPPPYMRTLLGTLCANAQCLQDEHREPGIFFVFQDVSVRTEGTFRLRLRLMNLGSHPAPNGSSNTIHTGVSPVLAQTFTEPFGVYSSKRFPGVPDITALSCALGVQGQKIPFRNKNGPKKQRRLLRTGAESSDDYSL